MIIEAIGTGSSIEEARRNAISELDIDPDNYEIDLITEIIDQPEKKLLGLFGGRDAKVRVYYEVEDEKPAKPAKREKPAEKSKPVKENKPAEEKKPAAAQAAAEPKEKKEINPVPAQEAEKYLRNILEGFGIENVEIKTEFNDDGVVFVLEGENLGILIGRRGDTLDAIQYLIGLVANRVNNSYYRISINTGNYREKRESSIESLAKKTAARALRTGKNISVEPMNPYERRIVHTTVQPIEGVSSWSVGEGSKRHVVIGPEGVNENQDGELFASFSKGGNRRHGGPRQRYGNQRGGRGGQRGGYNRGGNRRGGSYNKFDRKPADNNNGVISNVDRAPTKTSISAPLYGKIDVNRPKED